MKMIFCIFKNIYKSLISCSRNRVCRITKEFIENRKLENILSSNQKAGIQKAARKYCYANYLKEILNIINSCELCNHCESGHIANTIYSKLHMRYTKLEKNLSCIDLFSLRQKDEATKLA